MSAEDRGIIQRIGWLRDSPICAPTTRELLVDVEKEILNGPSPEVRYQMICDLAKRFVTRGPSQDALYHQAEMALGYWTEADRAVG